MSYFLGIDTSNYTTSASLYDSDSGSIIKQAKKLLPVKSGERGLRQSDAVFHHVQQLPRIIDEAVSGFDGELSAIGVSSRPRDADNSYMPCFTVGLSAGQTLSRVLGIPLFTLSHQCGHIAAAVYSSGREELFSTEFLAFHVSGGTTEAVIVTPDDENIFKTRLVGQTLDLNAGQLVDRVGVMLGLPFPSGRYIEELAEKNTEKINVRPTIRDCDCCLSGVENICRKAFAENRKKEYISALVLKYIEKTLDTMCGNILEQYGRMPVLFAGGVMADRLIRKTLKDKYGAHFASPEFSSDNASGTAILASKKYNAKKSPKGE